MQLSTIVYIRMHYIHFLFISVVYAIENDWSHLYALLTHF